MSKMNNFDAIKGTREPNGQCILIAYENFHKNTYIYFNFTQKCIIIIVLRIIIIQFVENLGGMSENRDFEALRGKIQLGDNIF